MKSYSSVHEMIKDISDQEFLDYFENHLKLKNLHTKWCDLAEKYSKVHFDGTEEARRLKTETKWACRQFRNLLKKQDPPEFFVAIPNYRSDCVLYIDSEGELQTRWVDRDRLGNTPDIGDNLNENS